MTMYVSWDNDEKKIIRIENEGHWTWDEYHQSIEEMATLIRTVDHRVDVVILDRPGAAMPSGSPMPHFNRAIKIQPPNTGFYILVTPNVIARTMVSIFNKLPGFNQYEGFRIVPSLEDAYTLIERVRAKTLT